MKTTLAISSLTVCATFAAANPLSLWASPGMEVRSEIPECVNFTLYYGNETGMGYPTTINNFPVDGKIVNIGWSETSLIPNITAITWTNSEEVYCRFEGEKHHHDEKNQKQTCETYGNVTVFTPPFAITNALCCNGPCSNHRHSKPCEII